MSTVTNDNPAPRDLRRTTSPLVTLDLPVGTERLVKPAALALDWVRSVTTIHSVVVAAATEVAVTNGWGFGAAKAGNSTGTLAEIKAVPA